MLKFTYYTAIALFVITQATCTAQNVKFDNVMHTWDSLAMVGNMNTGDSSIETSDIRGVVVRELAIINARTKVALRTYLAKRVASATFIICTSERLDHDNPSGSSASQPSKIFWIAGYQNDSTRLIYEDGGKVVDIQLACGESLLEGIIGSNRTYYPFNEVSPSTDLVSVWTPSESRVLLVHGLWVLRGSEWYSPNPAVPVPKGIERIAKATFEKKCEELRR